MSTIISINLSVKSITDEIYAASAIRTLMSDEERQPPMLTRHNEPALMKVIADAYLHTLLALLHHTADIDADNLDQLSVDSSVSVELHAASGLSTNTIPAIERTLEHAVAMMSMSLCYVGIDADVAQRYATLHRSSIDTAVALLRNQRTHPLIPPRWL